jgi:hypothetical protein
VSLLRAPLLQFFLLGALLFLAHRALRPPPPTQIKLTAEALAGLEQDFQRRSGRPASPSERQSLRDTYLDNEVLYREALARQLDRGDVIVRRRLIQKMDFVLDALADQTEAPLTESELSAYLAGHAERYRQPARLSLLQVFVARPSTTAATALAAEAALTTRAHSLRQRLQSGADPTTLGDPFVRGSQLQNQSENELAASLGPAFAAAVFQQPLQQWSEPIASSYGLHLVQVTASEPAQLPPLSSLRSRVESDLREERRRRARHELVRELRQHYDIAAP